MPDPVTYTAVLPIGESTVAFLSGLLSGERARRGTRLVGACWAATGKPSWCCAGSLDATRVAQLARDNQISASTAYRYLHEAIDVLAAAAPSLHGALLAARTAGYSHVHLDGTLIYTDRSWALGPTAGVDLWWSGNWPQPAPRVDPSEFYDGRRVEHLPGDEPGRVLNPAHGLAAPSTTSSVVSCRRAAGPVVPPCAGYE